MKKWLSILLFTAVGFQQGYSQHNLRINISGVDSNKGVIAVALYDSEDNFLDFKKAYRFIRIPVAQQHHAVFEHITSGDYAVVVFYDKNSNDQLDTNFIGIPKEAFGTSGVSKNSLGPPHYNNCKFYVNRDKEIQVRLKKLFQ